MEVYIDLFLSALLPVVVSIIFYLLIKRTKFGKINKIVQDIIIGLVFASIAVLATEKGVTINGATVNCRDASVLCAGLIFSPVSGVIAGTIAGVERYFATYWGAGAYSQIACSISTFLAGLIAFVIRKYLFNDKRCSSNFGFAIAIVVEVLHLSILFLTHMNDPYGAYEVIKVATAPMIILNSLAVLFATMSIEIMSSRFRKKNKRARSIGRIVQENLLILVILAYLFTTSFVFVLQTTSAYNESDSLLTQNITDIQNDISDRIDENMLLVAKSIANNVNKDSNVNLASLKEINNVPYINLVNEKGIIYDSTVTSFIGFDLQSNLETAKFMCLTEGTESLVMPLMQTVYDLKSKPLYLKYVGMKLDNGGFVQVGYDRERIREVIGEQVVHMANNRHIGESGYIVIAFDEEIIACEDDSLTSLSEIGIETRNYDTNTRYQTVIKDEKCFFMYTEVDGYQIIAIIPASQIFSSRDLLTYVNSFMEVLVFASLFVLLVILVNMLVVNNVNNVNSQLSKIIAGDLSCRVDVRTSREFISLTDGINSTVNKLKDYINEANERIDRELQLAKDIQISALPTLFNIFQNRCEFDIYATMDAAKQVGGDFYDFYLLDNNHLAFLVADVSGKSVAGAMFMMRAKTMIKNLAEDGYNIADIFTIANNKLCEGNDAGMFVTAWMGILDTTNGHVVYCNAGHNPPVVCHNDSSFEFLNCKPGFILAGMEDIQYKSYEIDLAVGDRIFLYTDGVTEAIDINKQLFSNDRLIDVLNKNKDLPAKAMLTEIKKNIDDFAGDQEQFDDITMLMLDYYGSSSKSVSKTFVAKDEELDNTFDFIEQQLEGLDVSIKTLTQIKLAFEEAFVNVAHYGYPDGQGDVKVIISVENRLLTIKMIDKAIEFNPLKATDPNIKLKAEERKIGGLGILLVKKVMDCVRYDYIDNQNILTMIKRI